MTATAITTNNYVTKEEEELRASDPDLELEGNEEELLEKMTINNNNYNNNNNKAAAAAAAVCPYSTASSTSSPSSSPFAFVPLNINRNSHQPSEGTVSFMEGITVDNLQKMTNSFYEKAFQDDTLDKFLRSRDDPHALRFAKWVHQKLNMGSYVWDDDRAMRRHENNMVVILANGGHKKNYLVHDRSSAHVAAWHSPKRPKDEVGRHFKLDECRVWMRLHFWALRESGLIEKSPSFGDYYVRFIAHFVRVYERNAPIFARDSFRWSSSPENIQQYIIDHDRKMKDVLGLDLNASLFQLPLEEVNDVEWPYNNRA